MNPIQQKIKESVWSIGEKISNSYKEKSVSGEYYNPRLSLEQFEIIGDIIKQSQLELLDIIRGEIEKLDRHDLIYSEIDISKNGDYLKRQDVLNLFKINDTKE